jgi:UDP-glucose 4-epimerase
MLAAESLLAEEGAGAEGPYNVGTGRETNVLELVDRLARLAGRDALEPEMAPAREGEIQRIALDSGRAASELGWRASTDVDVGLGRVLASVKDRASAGPRPRTG